MVKTLKQIAFEFRLKLGYSMASMLLLLSYILTLYGNNQLIRQTVWVNYTNAAINNLETLNAGIKDATTGAREYINTGDNEFLLLYQNSKHTVDSAFFSLKTAYANDARLKDQLATVNLLISGEYDKLESLLQDYSRTKYRITDSMLISFYVNKARMDRLRSEIRSMQRYQKKQLDTRNRDLEARYERLNLVIAIALTLALIFALFGFTTHRREYRARLVSEKRVSDYQQELQQRIAELGSANKELILMKRREKFAATGRIARTIAHEVRNPLTNIELAVSQIKADRHINNDNNTMLFDMVDRNTKRINQLISELLNATRFAELIYSNVSANSLLDDSLDLARDRIELNHITVKKNYSRGLCNISADAEKIKIAFLNIIVNAIEAMEPGKGILEIQTREEENKCVVEINDNGHGMTEEQLNNLFEPYFTTKKDGNGLGLTNTQNIILNHGGSISVNSIPGGGTSFTIKFEFPATEDSSIK